MENLTLKQLIKEIYETSRDMTDQAITDLLINKDDPISRAQVNRWRRGETLTTEHSRHERVKALHKRIMRRHKRTNLND